VWTKNAKKADTIAAGLKAGNISINQHGETPATGWGAWGGQGESGFGRLTGEAGLREFAMPVYVQSSQMKIKRTWWYPYDESGIAAFRAAATTFGARTRAERMKGLGKLLSVARRTLKNKL
jgi:hypothetical protein